MADGEKLLANPGFEEGFTIREDSAVNVANGWEPWYLTGGGFGIRPEWNQEKLWLPSIRVLHGDYGQKMFNTWGIHTAGIYQQAAVPEGSLLEFTIWVQVWSSDCDDICISPLEPCHPWENQNSHGNYRLSVGLDPTGGTDPLAESVVWSDELVYYDRWARLAVYAAAQADTVTVFTRGRPQWGVKHNDSYWDSASLRVVSEIPPTATPTATSTPLSLDQFRFLALVVKDLVAPTAAATFTPSPTATAPFTPTPVATATATLTPTATAALTPTPTAAPGDLTLTGRVYDAAEEMSAPIPGARIVVQMCVPRSFEAHTGPDGTYDLLIPADYANACSEVHIRVTADGYEPFEGSFSVADLRANPVRDFGLTPASTPTPTVECQERVADGCFEAGGLCRTTPLWRVSADGGVGITYIRYSLTQPGLPSFPPSCDPLTFEFVQMQNFGESVDVGGWTLEDAEGYLFTFSSLVLEPGARVRVWSRRAFPNEEGRPTDLFWGSDAPLWDDNHDTAILRDAEGVEQCRFSW